MDTRMVIIIVIAIVVAVGLYIVMQLMKSNIQNKLIANIQAGNFEAFYKKAESLMTRIIFPRYNLEYLKLNAYILDTNEAAIESQFDLLLKVRKNKSQTEDITMKAFNYFIGIEDKVKTAELIEKINTFTNERMVEEANIMYDIFILKKSNHLDQMLEGLDHLPNAQKGVNEYLISVQYKNLDDKENAKKYEKLSKKHLSIKK